MAINCAAIPHDLMESELFGHMKGSFTGASSDRQGMFQAAQGGTLFLDEIGELSTSMQVKLLRALQERRVRSVGASNEVEVDCRVLAATNRDLESAIKSGEFRNDLYFRLNVITVHLPPLREREGDVALLVRWLLARLGEEAGGPVAITPAAVEALGAWSWPGNVRELENELRRAVALKGEGAIDVGNLSPRLSPP